MRIRASGDTERILRKRIGVIIFEGTGRVWSELIMTISFFPFASSSKDLEPIGLSKDCSTSSFSESSVVYSLCFPSKTPARFFSGKLIFIVPLS